MQRNDKGRFVSSQEQKEKKRKIMEFYKQSMENNIDREQAQLRAIQKFNIKMGSAVVFYTQAKQEFDDLST